MRIAQGREERGDWETELMGLIWGGGDWEKSSSDQLTRAA